MKILDIKLEELIPYENNPRVNDRAVEVVAQSIREFGFKSPIIVDKDMIIVAGHTRYRASKRLGLDVVPVLIADDLNDEQVKAFRIMDNKSSEFAEWDYVKLLEEIQDLKSEEYDTTLTGFDDIELDDILNELEGDLIKEENKKDKPELEFTEELLEEHQYVVLYFDNTLDWQVAKEVFDLGSKQALASREGFEKVGIGRVVRGDKYVELLKNSFDKGGI